MWRWIITILIISSFNLSGQKGPAKVEIRKTAEGYSLYRNGEPYSIHGAGGFGHFDKLKEYGGNSIRMWSTEGADEVLAEAQKLGLTVTLGLFLKPVHYGMNYSDPVAVAEQKERVRKEVLKYKDHPALLMWGIGNEVGLISFSSDMYRAIQDIAKMIHEIDPNHPTTTMLAGAPVKQLRMIRRVCPDIDLIAINTFKEVPYIHEKLAKAKWTKPFIISEWGPTGYWESPTTSWGAFIEENTTEKAEACRMRYEAINKQKKCLGSYLFIWGHKQERTSTLFSLIHNSGHETETLDLMQKLWKGSVHSNLAPRVSKCTLAGKVATQNIKLKPGQTYNASVEIKDPENEQLIFYWEILHETTDKRNGEGETKPGWVPDRIENINSSNIKMKAPDKPGQYRLFMYAYDNHNHVSTANIPFLVE